MSGDGEQIEQFDTMFLSIAQHHPEGASQLLDTFVSFLARKTDFFIGGQEGQWEKMVMSTFKKFEKISRDKHEAELKEKREKEAARKAAKAKKEAEDVAKTAKITELTDAEAEKLQKEIEAKNVASASSTTDSGIKPPVIGEDDEDESEREPFKIKNKTISQRRHESYQYNMTREKYIEKTNKYLESIYLTEKQIEELQLNTVGQSDSPLWKLERSKRITASNFGKICKLRKSTHCKNTVKSLLYNTFHGNAATNWGKDHEENAIRQFENILNVDIENCGFFVDPEKPYLGASPDGLIGKYTIIEIKCPKSCSDMTPIQGILNGKIKFAEVEQGKMKLLRNHNYYYQVQGQLHVTGRRMCYFIVWTPLGLEYEKIMRNDEFWKSCCEKQLDDFFQSCFLPEIVDPQYPDREIKDLRPEFIPK